MPTDADVPKAAGLGEQVGKALHIDLADWVADVVGSVRQFHEISNAESEGARRVKQVAALLMKETFVLDVAKPSFPAHIATENTWTVRAVEARAAQISQLASEVDALSHRPTQDTIGPMLAGAGSTAATNLRGTEGILHQVASKLDVILESKALGKVLDGVDVLAFFISWAKVKADPSEQNQADLLVNALGLIPILVPPWASIIGPFSAGYGLGTYVLDETTQEWGRDPRNLGYAVAEIVLDYKDGHRESEVPLFGWHGPHSFVSNIARQVAEEAAEMEARVQDEQAPNAQGEDELVSQAQGEDELVSQAQGEDELMSQAQGEDELVSQAQAQGEVEQPFYMYGDAQTNQFDMEASAHASQVLASPASDPEFGETDYDRSDQSGVAGHPAQMVNGIVVAPHEQHAKDDQSVNGGRPGDGGETFDEVAFANGGAGGPLQNSGTPAFAVPDLIEPDPDETDDDGHLISSQLTIPEQDDVDDHVEQILGEAPSLTPDVDEVDDDGAPWRGTTREDSVPTATPESCDLEAGAGTVDELSGE